MSAYKAYGILWLSIHDVTSINSHNQSSKTTEYNQVYRNKMHYLNYPQTIRLCCSCKVRHISRKHSLMITCKCLWLCRNLQLCETGVDGKHNPRHSAQATNSRPVKIPAYFVVSPNWPVSRWYPINEGHLHLPKCDKNRRRYIIIHSKRPRSRTSLFPHSLTAKWSCNVNEQPARTLIGRYAHVPMAVRCDWLLNWSPWSVPPH